jgi:hypothetical protein
MVALDEYMSTSSSTERERRFAIQQVKRESECLVVK